jgi:O-antigen/teichoic acid export membrane protein
VTHADQALHPDRLTSGRLLARNVALNVAGSAAPIALAFFSIPVLLRGFGEARFGVLGVAWALIGYFSLFDLGMGRALTQLVSQALGRDSNDEIPSLVWTALWLLVPLGIAGALAVALTAPWLVREVLRIPPELQAESARAFQIFALAIPFAVHTAGLRGVLEATQSFGRVNALRLPLALVTFLGPMLSLPFSRTLPPAVAVLAVGRVAIWLMHVRACRDAFAPMRHVHPPAARHLRALASVGGWMTVSNVVSPLLYAADRFVVGAMLSMTAVAYYTTAYEAVTRLSVVTGVVLPVLFPALSLAVARDRGRATLLVDRALRLALVTSFPAAMVAGALAPEWLRLWVGGDVARHAAPLAQALVAGVFVNIVAQIVYTVVQSAGRADLTGKFHLIELGPYALVLWVLIPRMGALGAVVAWGLRATVDAALLFFAAARVIPEAGREIRRGAFLTLGTMPLLLAPLALPSAALRWAYLGASLAVAGVFAWRRLIAPPERAMLLRPLSARLPRGDEAQVGEAREPA